MTRVFQSSFTNHTFRQQKFPSLTCLTYPKDTFRIGSVNESCGAGAYYMTYWGPWRFSATSAPWFRPRLVHPTAQPQTRRLTSFSGKASSPPRLTPHAGSAVEGFKTFKRSPEGLLTSLFPLPFLHYVKSTFIKNKELFNGLSRLSSRLFRSVIIIYMQWQLGQSHAYNICQPFNKM